MRRTLALSSLALGAVACGGEDVGRPSVLTEVPIVDPGPGRPTNCGADAGLEFLVIEDFESGAAPGAYTNNEVCELCVSAGPDFTDACREECRKVHSPTDLEKPLAAEEIPGGRCDSRFAMHIRAGFFSRWGGTTGFPQDPPLDGREYEGISLWARRAPASRGVLRVSLSDARTDPGFDEGNGPICNPQTTMDFFTDGCDPFGGFAIMTEEWQLFLLPFDELRQAGFGLKAPFLDLGALRAVVLNYTQGDWDFWVDDIALYRERRQASASVGGTAP